MSGERNLHGERTRSLPRSRRVAAGAVLGGAGFAAASVAGIAGLHLAGQGGGAAVRAADDPRVWVNDAGSTAGSHHAENRRLDCGNLDVIGDDIEHSGGSWKVSTEDPTGPETTVASGTWAYAPKAEGKQVIATLPGASMVSAAQAAGATAHPEDGFHFSLRVKHADVEHERHFWVAACPVAAAPPAPPPAAGVQAVHATRAVAVPKTGAGVDELAAVALIGAGGSCLGAAAGMRRRREGDREPSAARTMAAVAHACRERVVPALPSRRLAVATLAAATVAGVVAGPARMLTIGAATAAAGSVEARLLPHPQAARLVPVDVAADATPLTASVGATPMMYAFPAPALHHR